jgi:lipopolysaccharide export LptBFGC system permease protein LptF
MISLGQIAPTEAYLILDLSYDDYLLLSAIRRGPENMTVPDLLAAANKMGNSGYLPQVFQAEMLYRFSDPLFFLPMAILAIVIGWRQRSLKKSLALGIPMLVVLPIVFNGLVFYYRLLLSNLGIVAVVALGFTTAIYLFVIGIVLFFILSLIILAAQHS